MPLCIGFARRQFADSVARYLICLVDIITSPTSLKIGMLGTARIAKQFVLGVAPSTAVKIVGIASRDVDRAEAFASQLSIPKSFSAYQALIADPDIDAVYVGAIGTHRKGRARVCWHGYRHRWLSWKFLSAQFEQGEFVRFCCNAIGRLRAHCCQSPGSSPP